MSGLLRRAVACASAALLVTPAGATASAVDPPMALPGDAAAASVRAERATWIVGAEPGPAADALARRHGGRRVGPAGTGGYVVPRARARALAAALRRRDLLVYAQPNTVAAPLTAPGDDRRGGPGHDRRWVMAGGGRRAIQSDPLTAPPDDWRAGLVDPALVPPPVTAKSPLIALVDSQLDQAHPEFAGGATSTLPELEVTTSHGTATASVAAAPVNGVGIEGVWPGARALNVPLPKAISCARSADRIATAIEHGAAVINMSYGSQQPCYPEYIALQFAVARGIVPIAAAGNEFAEGNPPEFPASLPHVLTVSAARRDGSASYFSNANAAIDLAAFGEDIMTAVPPPLDGDGTQDGYERQSGTSFAAPMVAAAAAWVKAARPDLSGDQVAQAIRLSATDVDRPGWDANTGFGLLSVGAALAIEPPPRDPAEPNDGIMWVDGRAFRNPDRPIYRGGKDARLSALLDRFEDPADVYRVRLRARTAVRVSANPTRRDDVALAAYGAGARSLDAPTVARSSHRGRRTERITLRNRSGRGRTFYVAVAVQRGTRDLDAAYTLRVG